MWSEVKRSEVKWSEVKRSEVKWSEVKWNHVKWSEIMWSEVKWSEIEWSKYLSDRKALAKLEDRAKMIISVETIVANVIRGKKLKRKWRVLSSCIYWLWNNPPSFLMNSRQCNVCLLLALDISDDYITTKCSFACLLACLPWQLRYGMRMYLWIGDW